MTIATDIREAVWPLRLIFWGALLWIIDFNINGFDVFNDVVGSLLVAIGVTKLANLGGQERYRTLMGWIKVVAWVSLGVVVLKMAGVRGEILQLLYTLFSLVQLASIAAFCVAMRWLCAEYNLLRSAQSWWMTLVLFLTLFVGPMGLLYASMVLSQLLGLHWNYNIGASVLLILGAMLVPFVHLFISTSRMRREATIGGEYVARGFDVLPPTQQ